MVEELQVAAQDKEYLQVLEGHEDWVHSLSWSQRGIASGGSDQSIIVHKPTGELDRIFEGAAAIFAVCWSPDMATLVSGDADGTVCVWDVDGTDEPIANTAAHTDCVRGVTFNDRGNVIATVSQDGSLKLWTPELQCTKSYSLDTALLAVKWMPNSRSHLAVGGDGGFLAVFDIERDSPAQTFPLLNGDCMCLDWALPNIYVGTSSGQLVVINAKTGKLLQQVEAHDDWVTGVVWNSTKRHAVTCGFSEDPTLKIWDADCTLLGSLKGHRAGVNDVCWSPDLTLLATAASDSTVRTWDASAYMSDELRQSRIEAGHDESCRSCRWSPDGTMVASGSDDCSLRIWSKETGQKITAFRDHKDWVTSIAWSPCSSMIASACGDGRVRVWSVREQQLKFTLKGHTDWVEAVAWSGDGAHIASGAFERDASIIIWNARTGQQLFTCKGHTDRVLALDFHPDGDALVSGGSDDSLRVWRVSSGEQERLLATLPSCVNAVRFCHTGVMVGVGCSDGAVVVFEFFSGDKLFYFQHHQHWIYCLAWSPLDTHIVAGSEDHTVRLTELADFPAGSDSDDDINLLPIPTANGDRSGSRGGTGDGGSRGCNFVPGFQLDSPVFSVSWHEDEGLICGCASGRLVQLSVCVKKGRRSTLAWEKSFRRTKKLAKSFRFLETEVTEEEKEGESGQPSKWSMSSMDRPMTVHPPVEVPLGLDDHDNGLGDGGFMAEDAASQRSRTPNPPQKKPNTSKSSICALL